MTRRRLAGWLIAGALLRLMALPLAGTGDVDSWLAWADLTTPGISEAYGVGQGNTTEFGYPPVAVFEFAAVNQVNRLLDPSGTSRRVFNSLIKLVGVAMECALCAALLIWGPRTFGAGAARRLALAVWLSPAILLAGPILGYLDTQAAVPAVFALWAATAGSPVTAGLFVVIGALTKPQGAVLVPAMVLVAWNQRGPARVRTATTAVLATVVVMAPFVMRGTLANMWGSMVRNLADMASGQAANVWWLLTWWVQRSTGEVVQLVSTADLADMGYPGVLAVGIALPGLAFAWGLWRSRRVRTVEDGALLAAWCVHAYFTLSVGVHENHLALAVPLVIVAGVSAERQGLAAAVALIATANIALFYGVGESGWRESAGYAHVVMPALVVSMLLLVTWTVTSLSRRVQLGVAGIALVMAAIGASRGVPHSLPEVRMITGVDATVLLALANIVVFGWHTRTLWRMTASDSASIAP